MRTLLVTLLIVLLLGSAIYADLIDYTFPAGATSGYYYQQYIYVPGLDVVYSDAGYTNYGYEILGWDIDNILIDQYGNWRDTDSWGSSLYTTAQNTGGGGTWRTKFLVSIGRSDVSSHLTGTVWTATPA